MKKLTLSRNIEAINLLELFIIATVITILIIRFYLFISGFPTIGGSTLHIAHMLWGGLLMAIAIIISFSFLSKDSRKIASIIGGIGFGFFIDELGKFITRDNNYFFQPSIAIIYIVIILIFIIFRHILNNKHLSKTDYVINAIEEMKELVFFDLNKNEKKRALEYLQKAGLEEEFTKSLFDLIKNADVKERPEYIIFKQIKSSIRKIYSSFVKSKWFIILITFFYLFQFITISQRIINILFDKLLNIPEEYQNVSYIIGIELLFTFISLLFITRGLMTLNSNRRKAFLLFKIGLLISILIVQFFTFYYEQFYGLFELFFNLIFLASLNFMINQENEVKNINV